MKHRLTLFSLLLLTLLHVAPLRAQDDGIVTQLQFGRQDITVPASGELVFYDFKGTDAIISQSSNNQHSLTVFKPEVAGMSVQITFENIDICNDHTSYSQSYPGEVLVYSGDPDPTKSFAWATTTSDVTADMLMPEGNVLATLDGVFSNLTYYSTADDGSLGVGVLWRYAKKCDGWVAKVKCVTLTDMQLTGAASSYEGVMATPKSKTGVTLAHACITTEGVMNPDHVTGIRFSLPVNEEVIDPMSVKLYADGRAGVKGLTPIEATVAADGDGYLVTFDKELGSGDNWFTLAADILGTATVGAKVKVRVDGVTTTGNPDGVEPFTAAEPVEISNPAVVCMVSGTQTIYVDETELAFYDDGGIDGDATANFSGITTFIPSVQGKKVQIDFTKVKIGSGSIYYQYINVYNGSEAKAENLIATIKTGDIKEGKTFVARSTAADGALTVEFGDNNTSFTGEGFEATVSLFEPQPMVMEGIAMVDSSDNAKPVRAGEQAVPMAMINILTKNTEPALTLDKLIMTANGAEGAVSGAYLATTADTPEVLAIATVTGESVVFDVTEPLALKEGNNMFMVLADIGATLVNDQEVKLTLSSVRLSGTDHQSEAQSVTRKVYNKLVSDAGTQDVTIYGSWDVCNKPSEYSYYGYDNISGDQVMIIRPGTEGSVVQLTFSKLAVRFPSYSYYGSNPVFKVINGAGTGGTVLYEATKNNQTGQINVPIKSTDATGALTIVFNTNGQRGTSTSDGFEAKAILYKSMPMQVDRVEVTQASTADVYSDGIEEEVLRLDVITEGGESPLSISELTVDLKGCEQWVKTVKLISSGSNKDYVQPVTTVASAPAAATVTLIPEEGAGVLAENDNYYWLAFDMVDKLKDNNEVDAKIVSMKVAGNAVTVNNADPEGVRPTRNIYIFHGDDEVIVDEPFLFTDNGGPNAYYTRDYSGAVVFKPADPSQVVRIHFNSFVTGINDELYIYNGSGTEDANQLLKLYGDNAEPHDVISSSEDGAITVRFRTGSYGLMNEGWVISVDTYTPAPLALASVTPESVASPKVYGGSQNNRMLRVQMEVSGERSNFALENISIDTAGTSAGAISNAKVWATGTEPTFLRPVQLGSEITPGEGVSELNFECEYKFPQAGTYNFWITYDVTPGIEAGSELKASLKSLTCSGETTDVSAEIIATSTVGTGMHGDYVVGTSEKADYNTFAAAIRDLVNNGVDGPVNMLVEDGTYQESFNFNPIPGACEVNRVTFRSESGNRDKVIIQYGEVDKNLGQGVVNFTDGASYITLQGVTVTSPADKCDGLIMLTGGCYHNTIDNCVIKGHTAATYEERVVLVYTYYLEEHDKNCNYFTLSNSRLEGGYTGLSVTGITNLNYPMMIHDVTVTGNTFVNQSSRALLAMGVENGLVVRGNRFVNDGMVMTTSYRNMDLYRCTGDVVVADNIIDLELGEMINAGTAETSNSAYGVYIRDISSALRSNKLIYNNDIRLNGKEGTSHCLYGMAVNDNDPLIQRADIAHNTIVITGAADTFSSPLFMMAAMTGSTVVNNVLQNKSAGTVIRGTSLNYLSGMTISDNAMFTNGEIWSKTPSDCNSFDAAVQAIGQPLGIAEEADFLSQDMRELRSAGNLMTARPLDYVTTDLLGNPRHATTPTMGAYEYTDQSGVPAWNEGYPTVEGITTASAVLSLSADKASEARYVVLGADAAAPDAEAFDTAEVVALHTNKVESVILADLAEATDYKAYVKLVSCLGEEAAEIAEMPFTTLSSEPVYPNPEALVTSSDVTEGNEGESVTLTGEGAGGMEPLTLTWTDQTGKVLGTGNEVTVQLTHSMTYRLTVTDARGKEAFDEINITVRGNQYIATFEDLALASESHWGGNDTNEPFYSGSFAFDTYYADYDGFSVWSHFTYANSTSTSYEDLNDQYNSAVGSGVDGSATYGICYGDAYYGANYLTVTHREDGDVVPGMWFTNTAWVMDAVKNGDGYSQEPGGFAKDDWYKVTVTGLLNGSKTGTIDFYLADFRADNEIDRYALDTWQWLDLSPLGKVNKLQFSLDGSKKNSIGLTTPAYFCVDNVGEGCPWQDADEQTVTIVDNGDGTLDLNAIFALDPAQGSVTYSVESPENIAVLDAENAGMVKVDGSTGGYAVEPFMLMAKATQQGRSTYMRIPVKLTYQGNGSGVDELTAETVKVYPVPAHEVLNISTTLDNYRAELIDMQGAIVVSTGELSGLSQIDLPALTPGVYMLRVSHATGTLVRRVIVK